MAFQSPQLEVLGLTTIFGNVTTEDATHNVLLLVGLPMAEGTIEPLKSASSYHLNGGPSYMRGVMFTEPNKPLSIEEFHMPRPKAGEVLIKTKACGVCHSDLHVIIGELPFASPCVMGHEITGEVVEHGPLTDTKIIERFPVGAHVVRAFIMPCGSCFFCNKGHDDLCEDFFAYKRAKGTLYDGETRLFLRNSEFRTEEQGFLLAKRCYRVWLLGKWGEKVKEVKLEVLWLLSFLGSDIYSLRS
ncbi:unnamed protein product [Camellia sinensis]